MSNQIKQKAIAISLDKRSNYILIGFICLAIVAYIYFANAAVRTLTILEKSKAGMQSLSIDVSEMEAKRLSVDNNVNISRAKHLGFVEVANQTFIMNKAKKTALSLKTD